MTRRAPTDQTETGFGADGWRLSSAVGRFGRDTSGATMIEYGLIAGLTFLAIVGALRYYAERLEVMYQIIGAAVMKST
ncbi:Flp family type IVb pilin [Methylobacterium marchantiae]|uniref:Flp family type IVb pilin n=1 Tax=Methylobacterium marchantiae TaxID=600331 RepID=A0ABW3X2H1_9HYPH